MVKESASVSMKRVRCCSLVLLVWGVSLHAKKNPRVPAKKDKPALVRVEEKVALSQKTVRTVQHQELAELRKDSQEKHLQVLFDVGAEFCPWHEKTERVLQEVAQRDETLLVARLNIDDFEKDPALKALEDAFDISIDCVPTHIVLIDGKVSKVFEGIMPAEEIIAKIKQA